MKLVQIACGIFAAIVGVAVAADNRPNVVMIISDDQAWTDYGFMGHDAIKTPRLDRLASESVTFTRGYVPSALCRPSLATMITGLYAHQHKISGNDPAAVPGNDAQAKAKYLDLRNDLIRHVDQCPTLPKLLGQLGYVSFQSGKWWEGNFARGGFTHGMTHGDPARGGRHGDAGLKIGREGLQPIFDFIDGTGEKPFLLWYAPMLPHTPHTPPERLLKKYQTPDRPIELARYYAMCEWFDETCGQLLDYLDDKKLSANTLVVYVTDNGWIQRTPATELPEGWNSPFAPKSKQSPYDGGTRTPIMIRWPGKLRPKKDETTLVSSIDLAPTILAACGLEATKDMRGVNLLEVAGGKQPGREEIFGETFAHDVVDINDPEPSLIYRWCIEGQWKLLLTYDGQAGRHGSVHATRPAQPQLFDLHGDPTETHDLAEQKPEIVVRLAGKIEKWWTLKALKPRGLD